MTLSAACAFSVASGIRPHSTGKERDSESGNDYFGARYYANSMGRWLSPDWSAVPAPIPYANLSNPQSLNLYGYVNNNPLSAVDDDGHDGCAVEGMPIDCGEVNSEAFVQCPANLCGPVAMGQYGKGDGIHFGQFVAEAGGAKDFVSMTDIMGGLTEYDGLIYNEAAWNKFVLPYEEAYKSYMAAYISKQSNGKYTVGDAENLLGNPSFTAGGNTNFRSPGAATIATYFGLTGAGGDGCMMCREGSSPSLHYHNGGLHLDSYNGGNRAT